MIGVFSSWGLQTELAAWLSLASGVSHCLLPSPAVWEPWHLHPTVDPAPCLNSPAPLPWSSCMEQPQQPALLLSVCDHKLYFQPIKILCAWKAVS